MFPALLLLFTVIPFVELFLLLEVGRRVGALPTLGLVIATGVLGAALARAQGFAALQRIQREMAEGRMPAGALLDGVLILVAGVLLITPGVLTDAVGLLLLVPPGRALVARGLARWARGRVQVIHGFPADPRAGASWGADWAQERRGPRGDVIDVQAEVRDVEPGRGEDAPAERLTGRP